MSKTVRETLVGLAVVLPVLVLAAMLALVTALFPALPLAAAGVGALLWLCRLVGQAVVARGIPGLLPPGDPWAEQGATRACEPTPIPGPTTPRPAERRRGSRA